METQIPKASTDNEINIFEIINYLLKDKWLIAVITILFVCASLVYIKITPTVYDGFFEIREVDEEFISKFAPLNLIEVSSTVTTDEYFLVITAEKLMKEFLYAGEDQRPEIYRFKKNERNKHEVYYRYEFRTTNMEAKYAQLQKAFHSLEETVKEKLLNEIYNKRDAIDFKIKNYILRAEDDIKFARSQYQLEILKRIAYLNENALIARDLDIMESRPGAFDEVLSNENVIIMNQDVQRKSADVKFGSLPAPYYLRGYDAIEKELYQLKKRKVEDEDLFIPIMPELKIRLAKLVNNRTVEEINKAIELIPLKSNQFHPVSYDLSQISYSVKLVNKFVIILFFAVGLIVSCIIVLCRQLYRISKS